MNAKLEIQSWKSNNLRWWIRVWVEDVCPGLNLNTQRLILADLERLLSVFFGYASS